MKKVTLLIIILLITMSLEIQANDFQIVALLPNNKYLLEVNENSLSFTSNNFSFFVANKKCISEEYINYKNLVQRISTRIQNTFDGAGKKYSQMIQVKINKSEYYIPIDSITFIKLIQNLEKSAQRLAVKNQLNCNNLN